jgi:hypothetical protein
MTRLLFSIFCLMTLSINAQSQITFEHTTNKAGGLSNEFDVALHDKFTNNSDQESFRWVRKSNILSPSWESAVCDNVQCHDVIVDSADFTMKKGEFFDFIIHFYPYNKTGTGSMEVYVYAVNDPSINASSTYEATIWGLSTNNLTTSAFIYPNPVQNILNIKTDKTVSSVSIFSLAGALVATVPMTSDLKNIAIGYLNNGIYYAEINTSVGVMREKFVVSK